MCFIYNNKNKRDAIAQQISGQIIVTSLWFDGKMFGKMYTEIATEVPYKAGHQVESQRQL